MYFGLSLGYEPYIDGQITQLNTQITSLAKSIPADDQARVITFYSEITNIRTALSKHVAFSHFLSWLEANTEGNIYYTSLNLNTSNNQVSLMGLAKTEEDVNQQAAIFEAAPAVKNVAISQISLSDVSGLWQFTAAITVDPAAVLRAAQSIAPAAPSPTPIPASSSSTSP